MSRAVHYLEREARELEEAYLAEISAGYYALVRSPPVEPTPLPEILAEILAEIRSTHPVSEIPDGRCHRGLRAPRLVKDMADLAANPDLFRCSDCRMLLDAPLPPPKPIHHRRRGKVGDRILTAVAGGTDRFSEISDSLGISRAHTSNEIQRLMRYGAIERYERGRYRLTEKNREATAHPAARAVASPNRQEGV